MLWPPDWSLNRSAKQAAADGLVWAKPGWGKPAKKMAGRRSSSRWTAYTGVSTLIRTIVAALCSALFLTISNSQPISFEFRMSYLPSFSEIFATTSRVSDFEGFGLIGGAAYWNLDDPLPLSVGVGVSIGRKVLLNYPGTSPPVPGTGPTDMSRKVQLLLLEVPVLYRFAVMPAISIHGGVLIGHAIFKRLDHIVGQDFESTVSKIILSPQAEVGIGLPLGLRIGAGMEYRPLKIVFLESFSYKTTYSLDGVWYRLSLGYSL